jgi:2-amino-4-hydroxy-6-hydroxymethyldihydropteridine diphosphokinase
VQIPHPALPKRRFALTPLAEIAGELMHPITLKTITEMLVLCPDSSPVYKMS